MRTDSIAKRRVGTVLCLCGSLVAQELRHIDTPMFQNAVFDPVRQRVVATSWGGYSFDWDGAVWRHAADVGAPAGFPWFDVATQRRMTLARRFVGTGFQLDLYAQIGSGWQLQPMGAQPPLRNDFAFAYDAARGELLAFGGYSVTTQSPLGDTWTWNGVAWTQHLVPGPQPRTEASIGYDSSRQRVVLFGGRLQAYSPGPLTDTWEWDGTAWTMVPTPVSPPPHVPSLLVHDVVHQRMVMIGRADGGSFPNEAWEYDGSTWTQIATPPVVVGIGGPVVYDLARGETLLLGGFAGNVTSGRVAAWDGTAWSLRPGFGDLPGQSFGTEVTVAPNGTDLCLFAPWVGGGASSELWSFDGVSWTLTASGGPPPRGDALLWTLGGTVYVHGGFGTSALNDLWAWNGLAWAQQFPSSSPPPRARSTWTIDSVAQRVVVFGGTDLMGLYRNDTWTFDGVTWQQALGPAPPARIWGAMAHDALRNRIVLHGGLGGTSGVQVLTDTWEWNGLQWQQIAAASAPPRDGRMTYDPTSQRILHFAPGPGGQYYRVHSWDGVAWTPLAAMGLEASANALRASIPRPVTTPAGRVLVADQWAGMLEWLPAPARAVDYGVACGVADLRLTAASLPRLGDATFGFDLVGAPGGGPVALAGASSAASLPFFGCTLLVAPDEAGVLAVASPTGFATVPLPVPAMPALTGLDLWFQAACLSPASSHGFALSAGLRIELGR